MKRLLFLLLAFAVNAYGASSVPNIFATQPSGNVPASYLDVDFALISNYNTFSNYLVDSGAANAYVVTFPAGTTGSLAAGLLINFKAGADNTGASTLAANGMTAKNITNYDATALAAGQIKAGAIVSVIYDGTQFKLAGQPGGVSLVAITDDTTTNATMYPAWVTADTGNLPLKTSHSTLTWNPSTGSLGATTFVGAISGTTGSFSSGLTAGASTWISALSNISGYSALALNNTLTTGGISGIRVSVGDGISLVSNAPTGGLLYGQINGSTVTAISSTGLAVTGTTSSTTFKDSGGNLIISSTAPTIASGFGTSPSILANNTAAFQVTVGSGGTDFSGVITMPAAPNGWVCQASEVLSVSNSHIIKQYDTGTETTQIGLVNFNSQSGATVPFAIGATIRIICMAF